jgi:autotransporter-associated beta strand protein
MFIKLARQGSNISKSLVAALVLVSAFLADLNALAQNERLLGLDISAWQGDMSQTTWNDIRNVENRQFAVIRSSRGGSTGYYDQSDAPNNNSLNTLSQRYDDPFYIQNMNRASAAGMFVGSYHFSRPDIIETTKNSGGIRNNGTDEADHFIQMAGPFMRPGYLVPVHDLEAGDGIRTSAEMAQFSLEFSDRIYERMGIRPAIYINGNYNNILAGSSQASRDLLAKPALLRPSVVSPAYPTLWIARWPNQANPYSIDVQNGEPKDTISSVYGIWDDYGTVHPWTFWQYASTMRLESFKNGDANLDVNVVRGGVEFIKDALIPAVWTHDGSGPWTTLTNWNSGIAPITPVPGPGQVTPVASGPLPSPRLPGINDTVILERPNSNIVVTLSSGSHNIRKLYVREVLNIVNALLTVNYVPAWDSTTNGAQFSAAVAMTNSTFNVHTLQVDAAQTLTLSNATVKFQEINLMPGADPAVLAVVGNVTFPSHTNTIAPIRNGNGSGTSAYLNLFGGTRNFLIPPNSDVSIEVPVQNGGLSKSGPGTLRLTSPNTYADGTVLSSGKLWVNNTTGSGTGGGTVTVNGGILGGTGTISGVATINSAGTIAPGTDAAIGTLTFSSSPVFNGTNRFRVNRNSGSPLSDRINRSGGSLNFGGTLTVTNAGATLTGGEVFTVFSATSYTGSFVATNLPDPGTGLNWYLGRLSVDGTLRVNRRPVATYVSVDNTPGQTLTISKASLIANGSDADGDTLSLLSFDAVTTNGITLSSDGANIYYLNNADVPDQFNFVLSDGRGGTATGLALIGQGLPVSPAINDQPDNITVEAGQNATFYVAASGSTPLSYQWRFNGENISSATAASYTRFNAQAADQGTYSVVVANNFGSVTSTNATLTVTPPPPPLEVIWELAPGARSYLTINSVPEQRGLAFNPVTRRLLIVHRITPSVHVLNEHGTNLWTLNTSTVTGGFTTNYQLLLIDAADDGAIYACNLKNNASAFKIYRWANDSSATVPTVAFTGDPSPGTPGYRWGDTFDVRGSGTNTQILIGPRMGTNVVLFSTTDGLQFTPQVINLNGLPAGECGLNLTFGTNNTFWGTSHTNALRLVSFDPVAGTASPLRTYSNAEVPFAVNPIGFSADLKMLAGIYVESPNHLRVYDLSPTNGVPVLLGTTNFSTDNSNTLTGTGAVRFSDDVVFALDANNGLMAARIRLPNPPLRVNEVSKMPGQLKLRGTGRTGTYLLETTSAPFTNWTSAGNVFIGTNGLFDATQTLSDEPQRFYRLRKP